MAAPSSSVLPPGTACVECRRRKTRCDGIHPECSRCARLGKQCRYEPPDRRPRIDRMEGRVQELEERLEELTRRPPLLEHELIQRLMEGPRQVGRTPFVRPFLPFFSESPNTTYTGQSTILQSGLQEGYGSTIPRALLDAGLQRLHPTADVTPELSNYLVRVLIPSRGQFHFYVDVHRFIYRLRLPPGHPSAIHPCLLNAIYLGACSIIGGASMIAHEQLFLNRTRQSCEQSLAFADRLVHFMWANVILAQYYLRAGRVVEAHNTIASTVRFAVGAGLHTDAEMEDTETGDMTSLALPPADPIDIEERVNLWFSLTMCEAGISLGTSLPSSAPPVHRASIDSLFFRTAPSYDTHYSAIELKARSAILLHATRNFLPLTKDGQVRPDLPRYELLLEAHSAMERVMPDSTDPRGILPSETFSWFNPELVQAHLAWHTATILLHNVQRKIGLQSTSASGRMLQSAEAMVEFASRLRASEGLMPVQANLDSIWYYYTACEVFIQDMRHRGASASAQDHAVEEAEQSLTLLFDILLDLTNMYPSWQRSIQKLPQLLLGDIGFETID